MCNWKSYTIYDSNQGHAGTSTAHIHTGMWGVGQIALFSLLFLLCLSLFAKLLLAVSVIIKLLTCSSLVSHMTVNAQTEILAINSGPECVSAEKNKKTKSIHTHTHVHVEVTGQLTEISLTAVYVEKQNLCFKTWWREINFMFKNLCNEWWERGVTWSLSSGQCMSESEGGLC